MGDAVLIEVTKRLSASLRSYDLIGRYGGEEFLIVVPSCSPADLASNGERLRDSVADKPVDTSSGTLSVTISLGLASAPIAGDDTSEYEALLRASDDALYAAKAKGRNRVEIAAASRAFASGAP